MPSPSPLVRRRYPSLFALAACLVLAFPVPSPADDPPQQPTGPRLSGSAGAAGIGLYQNDRWGLVQAQIKNDTDADHDVRLYVRFDQQPAHQFARSVRIPAHASRQVQLPAHLSGVANDARSTQNETILLEADREVELGREIGLVRTANDANLFLVISEASDADDAAAKAMEAFRLTAQLPKTMAYTAADRVMQFDVGWDGVKAAIITDNHAPLDGAQTRGLRRWLSAGGTLVVFADQVESEAMARVLGDDWPIAYVDRITLTTLAFKAPDGSTVSTVTTEQPIVMTRLLTPTVPGTRTLLSVDGWPAALAYPVGRGRVVVMAVGGRAWFDPGADEATNEAKAADNKKNAPPKPPSPTEGIRHVMVNELLPATMMIGGPAKDPADVIGGEAALGFVTNQIGRTVIDRNSVGLVLGVFVAVMAGLGLVLGRRSSGEWLGVAGVGAAIVAGGLMLGMGYAKRGDIEPTAASLRMVHLQPGRDSAAVDTVVALYDAGGSQMTLTGAYGGWGWPTGDSAAGHLFRMTWLDLDRWTWPNLDVPADAPRTVMARQTMPMGRPIDIAFRYTESGLTGTLAAIGDAPMHDALLVTHDANIRVDLAADGQANIAADGVLPSGVFFAGSVVGEAQQDRKQILDDMLLAKTSDAADGGSNGADIPPPRFGGPTILAWSAGDKSLVDIEPAVDRKTQTLWEIPLRVVASEPGASVRVPWPMVQMIPQRISEERYGLQVMPIYSPALGGFNRGGAPQPSAFIADFQVPDQVMPLNLTGATAHLDITAIGRKVRVLTIKDGKLHEIGVVQSPDGPIALPIPVDKLDLKPDGRIKLAFDVGAGGEQISMSSIWKIRYFGLEVAGKVGGESAKPAP